MYIGCTYKQMPLSADIALTRPTSVTVNALIINTIWCVWQLIDDQCQQHFGQGGGLMPFPANSGYGLAQAAHPRFFNSRSCKPDCNLATPTHGGVR